MSECCTSQITALFDNLDLFEDLDFFMDIDAQEAPVVTVFNDQYNCAARDDLHELAMSNVPFYGEHSGKDGVYNAGLFAAADGDIVWLDALNGMPVARVNDDMSVVEADMDEVRKYYRILARAKELMEGENDA